MTTATTKVNWKTSSNTVGRAQLVPVFTYFGLNYVDLACISPQRKGKAEQTHGLEYEWSFRNSSKSYFDCLDKMIYILQTDLKKTKNIQDRILEGFLLPVTY